jgi:hypothetical protein
LRVVDEIRNQEEAGYYERGDHHALVGLDAALLDQYEGDDQQDGCRAVQGCV